MFDNNGITVWLRSRFSRENIANTKIEFLIYVFILVPFFEPMCLQYLSGPAVNLIELLFTAARSVISLCVVLRLSLQLFDQNKMLVLAFAVLVPATVISTGFALGFVELVKAFSYLGLMGVLAFLSRENRRLLLDALVFIFGCYFIIGLFTVYVLPHGMTQSKGAPIFFFGGKNSFFIWSMPLVVAVAVRSALKDNTISWASILLPLACALVSFRVDSASSAAMFLGCAVAFLIIKSRKANLIVDGRVLFCITAAIFIIVVLLDGTVIFKDLFALFNRSVTLTGRTILWDQALANISSSPLWGLGPSIQYELTNGALTGHPHSFFLQYCASYGCVFMFLFVADIVVYTWKSRPQVESLGAQLACVGLFILLMHSMFDIMNIYLYLVMRFLYVTTSDAGCLGGK